MDCSCFGLVRSGCGMWLDVMVGLCDVAGCNGGDVAGCNGVVVGCGWM